MRTGGTVRMHTRFFSKFFLVCRGNLMGIGIGRMMTKMLCSLASFMLAIGRYRAPAELKCENR